MERRVSDLMKRKVFAATPELPVRDLTRELVEKRLTTAPVVDAQNHVVGVVSLVDVAVHSLFPSPDERARGGVLRVGDIMCREVIQVEYSAPLSSVVGLFRRHRVQSLVVTREGKFAGQLSLFDLLDVVLEKTRPRLKV